MALKFTDVANMSETLSLGNIIYTAVKPIIKIYFIVAVGFFLAKKNIYSIETTRNLSDSVIRIFLPCLIFNKVVASLQGSDIKAIGIICFEGTLTFGIGGLCSALLHYTTRSPKKWVGGLMSAGLFGNVNDLPVAYIQTLSNGTLFTADQGNKGVAYISIFVMVQLFYQFNLGSFRLIGWDFRDSLKDGDEETALEAQKQNFHDSSEITPSSSIDSMAPERPSKSELKQHEEFLNLHSEDVEKVFSNGSSRSRQRAVDLRRQKSQDINDVIDEYSEAEALKNPEMKKSVTGVSDISVVQGEPEAKKNLLERNHLGFLVQLVLNFKKPPAAALIVSIVIAMVPQLKALFVQTKTYMPQAPDDLPPLSFMMDFTAYLGNAAVPLGLLILGGTLARLQLGSMPKGFWKCAIGLTMVRLVFMPIIGVAIVSQFKRMGWFDDVMIEFVCYLNWGLPTATTLVYLTAFFSNTEEHLQMDCLAVCFISQYLVLFISLPVLVSYTLKAKMGF